MDLGLAGEHVVVTAAGSGIGRAIAEFLATEGAEVLAISAHQAPPARRLDTVAIDLLDPDAGEAVAREVAKRTDRIAALITVLGGPDASDKSFAERDDARWQHAFEFNLQSGIRTIRSCLPFLERSECASIVHTGSDLGRQPDPKFIEYAAMKAALLSLSKSLSQELGPRIRSNVCAPGPTRTPGLVRDFTEVVGPAWGVSGEEAMDRYVREERRMASERLALPEEVARAAAFLASPASAPMTGTELVIDGGTRKAV
ncbi:SDR family NAD(P)-dependent oxidoreductase [Leucobacter sp. USHLN153]|uniref:SDR family NAD(P)-dependent oxidoreductase n=1 Tax=Leucobacter sp. USHLN153 TaxID=3081268 RepID=UPI00301B2E76